MIYDDTETWRLQCQVMCQGAVKEMSIGKTPPQYYLLAVLYDLLPASQLSGQAFAESRIRSAALSWVGSHHFAR